jgi:RNA polymerase sigma factor (sigma-70 family)
MSPSHRTASVAWPQGRVNSSPTFHIREPQPTDSPASLLTLIKDGANADAWEKFVRQYGPVVYGFARKWGLQDADAADITQEVLWSVARYIGKMEYDPARGTFRGWLSTVTRNKIFNFLADRRKRSLACGCRINQERLDAVPDESAHPELEWELEYRRLLSARAMGLIKHRFQLNTWKAFWATAVEGRRAADVGAELGMAPGAVYVAKCRVRARLRDKVQLLEAESEKK